MSHTVCYAVFGNLVKFNSVVVIKRQAENVRKVPRNCLSLSIRVGCEVNLVAFFCELFKFFYKLFFTFDDFVFWCKFFLYINAESGFRQISYMSHRRNYLVISAEVFFDCFSLSR